MRKFIHKSLSLLLAALMLISFLPQITIESSAANVNYVYSGNYVYNWGQRGTVATFLSPMAEEFYEKYNVSLESLSDYSGASSTSSVPGSALYGELKSLMTTAHSYKTSYDATKNLYKYTDCQNSGGKISSFYSGISIGPGWGEGGSWNREHTWPNSKGLGGQDENDIMMLRPTATSENSSRGNTAYGESGSYYDPNEESNGAYNLHGDVARIVLYTYVRWGNTSYMWGSSGVMESKEILLKWMEEDPVDTWELGRNDAVQSITGTRNVFVDFPELAFELFNADVPPEMDTPSGEGVSYTITAQSGNSSYGTVSLFGNKITAYPYTGYQVSGYQIVSGTANVSQSGNVFTVTPSSDCTVKILFEARTPVTLTFVDRGNTVSTLSSYVNDTITTPVYEGTLPNGYVFGGWVEQQIVNAQTKPAVLLENTNITVSASKTYYALYVKVEEGSTGEDIYQLVTSNDQLIEGASIVIAASASTNLAMKSTGGTNNRYAGTITKNADNTISFEESALIDIITLGAGLNTGTYSLYSEVNGQYLAAGTSSTNALILQNNVDSCASFVITVNSDGTASMISQTSGEKNSLRYNSSANVFACYSTGQKAVSLYVKQGGGVSYYTTNPIECDHSSTASVTAKAPTCTEIGYTAGIYCNDCKLYISGHETVDALGHSYGAWIVILAPTCTTAGTEEKICSVCDDIQTQTVAATGHSMNSGVITTNPTCTENGIKTFTCSECGYTTTEAVAATGHSMNSGVITTNPTCTENGIKTFTCSECGYTTTEAVAATGHSMNSGVITTNPTCTENGIKTFTCSECGYTTTETVAATGHSYVNGTCTGCGNTVSAIEGTYVKITSAGELTSGKYVMVVSTGYAPGVVDDTWITAVQPVVSGDVVTDAQGGVWTLTVDGTSVKLADSNGVFIAPKAGNTNGLASKEYDWAWSFADGTFTFAGTGSDTTKLASNTGAGNKFRAYKNTTASNTATYPSAFTLYKLVEGGVTPCEHANESYQEIAPTCTEQGYTLITCADCGEELGREDYVDALGHTAVVDEAVAPTCTTTGLTEGSHCSVCGEAIIAQEEIAALPHNYESVITYATTKTEGYTTHTCTVCGDSYVDGHTSILPMNLRFASATLALESDLSVMFQVKQEVIDTFDDIEFKFELVGSHIQEMTEADYNAIANNRYIFKFSGISPRFATATIQATIYGTYEGVRHSYTMEYSVIKYCENTLAKTTDSKLQTLIVDLLNYGTAHQIYGNTNLDNLANANLTEQQKALGTSAVPEMTNYMNVKYATHATPTARFKNATLLLKDAVVVRCKFNIDSGIDINTITVKITSDSGDDWVIGNDQFETDGSDYYINFRGLSARRMRDVVYLTIYQNGVAISHTLRYSIESYVAGNYASAADALKEVILSMMKYGDSAAAYLQVS